MYTHTIARELNHHQSGSEVAAVLTRELVGGACRATLCDDKWALCMHEALAIRGVPASYWPCPSAGRVKARLRGHTRVARRGAALLFLLL